jgi:septum formation protein
MEHLILASTSPRRKMILKKFNIPFSVIPPHYEEIFNNDEPGKQVLNLSKNKVQSILENKDNFKKSLILGADTCINLDGRIIGKPKSLKEAKTFLNSFSGRSHEVITGLTLYNGIKGHFIQKKSTTLVNFANLENTEIEWYLRTLEWEGAAGGYRIQDKGSLLIESISGSWYNVMGLPIRLFYGMVATQGLALFSLE